MGGHACRPHARFHGSAARPVRFIALDSTVSTRGCEALWFGTIRPPDSLVNLGERWRDTEAK